MDTDTSSTLADRDVLEGAWQRVERWTPWVTLPASLAIALLGQLATGRDVAPLLVGSAVAAVWVWVLHTRATPEQLAQPLRGAIYLAGLLAIATFLMAVNVVFFLFCITGFIQAAILGPTWAVLLGTFATSIVLNVSTWGGVPRDIEAASTLAVLVVVQTVLIGLGMTAGRRIEVLSEERRRAVEHLQSTLAENEQLHEQLVDQARAAGIQEERQRLAREIHDTLAQGLAGIITQLEAAAQATAEPRAHRRHLDTAADLARESLDEARRSVRALAPVALDRRTLATALEELAARWEQRQGISVDHLLAPSPDLSPELEVALLRVAQEALTNVAKHAAASRVQLTLATTAGMAALTVADDGRGFDVAADRDGFGLVTMRRRTEDLGGDLRLSSGPTGTTVRARFPLRDREVARV